MTTPVSENVIPATFGRDDAVGWESWLRDQIDPTWREDEWDQRTWLFTGDVSNPRTALWKCSVHACPASLDVKDSICTSCRGDMAALGQAREPFIATHVPSRRTGSAQVEDVCIVARHGAHCGRPVSRMGLCHNHHDSWQRNNHQRPPAPRHAWDHWLARVARPLSPRPDCCVLGCARQVTNGVLCLYHWHRWRYGKRPWSAKNVGAELWATRETPYLGAGRFSLAPLTPRIRLEVLYGLQQRDGLGCGIEPKALRRIVVGLSETPTLVGLAPHSLGPMRANAAAVLRQLCYSVRLGFDEFHGILPADKDVLDLRALRLKSSSRSGHRLQAGTADLTPIPQPWLRSLLTTWVDAEHPTSSEFGTKLRAVVLASQALSQRPAGGNDPARLQFSDMTAVADFFRSSVRLDGKPYSNRHRSALFHSFCVLLDVSRKGGLLDCMSGSFARHRMHRIVIDESNEDEIGRAIPEFVIRQLDTQLETLGRSVSYGQLSPDEVAMMFRTVYLILRDTGRRPHEVAMLPRSCLETVDHETSLVWDNHKGKRKRRRLPITQETTQTVRAWQHRRDTVPAPAQSAGFLFPAISDAAGMPHLHSNVISEAIRLWVTELPDLHCDVVDPNGDPLPFERSKIFPYAFRHSYAQRHADAGTPVDVLKELLDHVSAHTTMGYYKVSLKRKRDAVKTLSAHAVDRSGTPAPFHSGLGYQRSSVAVPFGGCTEPSNVKAGGKACPIRFQCAACPFYRPDPSYLPAIEQQINDVRADRETAEAIGAAEFVIRNLTEQIDSYRDVVAKMRKKLADLPADERTEIEEASTILRKARASSGHTLLPLTVTTPEKSKKDDE